MQPSTTKGRSATMGKGGNGAMPPEEMKVYLKGKVVDVTKFQRSHPGGAKALRIFKDRDATEQFEMCAPPAPAADRPADRDGYIERR